MAHQNGTAGLNGLSKHTSPKLLLLSANTESSLQKQIKLHVEWVLKHPDSVADLVYTRANHREHLPQRAFVILDGANSIQTSSAAKIPPDSLPLVLVFSGQGAQWPMMAKELIQNDTAFRDDLLSLDAVLQRLQFPPSWSIIGMSTSLCFDELY